MAPPHTCPKCTVIGRLSSRSLGSLFSANGEGVVRGNESSGTVGQPFSAMSCTVGKSELHGQGHTQLWGTDREEALWDKRSDSASFNVSIDNSEKISIHGKEQLAHKALFNHSLNMDIHRQSSSP